METASIWSSLGWSIFYGHAGVCFDAAVDTPGNVVLVSGSKAMHVSVLDGSNAYALSTKRPREQSGVFLGDPTPDQGIMVSDLSRTRKDMPSKCRTLLIEPYRNVVRRK